jgi:ribose transport system substrate-binding protein
VAADLSNGGVKAVATGASQATAKIGWKVIVLDGKGGAQGRTEALAQAIALKLAGIVLGGFDAAEQSTTIAAADYAIADSACR